MEGMLAQAAGMPQQPQGLLARLAGGVQSVVSSPITQGVGLAAAFGLNPALGLLAAPGIARNQERGTAAQKLLTRRLQEMETRDNARNAVSSLIGMVSQRGPGLDPLQTQFLQASNEINPGAAIQQLGGLLGFGQEPRAEPSIVRELDAVGLPRTVEGIEALSRAKHAGTATDDELRGTLLALQVAERQRLAAQGERDEAQRRRTMAVQTSSTFKKLTELATLTERLQGTALETGSPFNEVMRDVLAGGAPVLERLGFDGERASSTVADFDRFNKLATELQIAAASLEGSSAQTNMRFEALRESMANIGTSPGAIPLILSDVTRSLLDAAEIEGLQLESRDEMRAFAERMSNAGSPEGRRYRFDPESGRLIPR